MTKYRVSKMSMETGDEIASYGGGYTLQDVKDIARGYKENEHVGSLIFFMRKNSKVCYLATAEEE